MPLNQQKQVTPYEFVNEMDILPMLEHDRIDILFRKLNSRLQPYFAKNVQEMATHFMNYDHFQIIAALNDERILKEMVQDINEEMNEYSKKPVQVRLDTSIWTNKVSNYDINELICVSKEVLNKELEIFDNKFKKKNHILNVIENNVRKIDHLRVDQLMHLIKNKNSKTLIEICEDKNFLLQPPKQY